MMVPDVIQKSSFVSALASLRALLLVTVTSWPTWAVENKNNAWVGFRNGGQSHAEGLLPLIWTPESNIAWQCELDGYGQSSPVIWGDRVYVTSVRGENKETLLISAFDLPSGNLCWVRSFNSSMQEPSDYMHARAAPTPVVDSAGVYAFFESGDLVALTHDGQLRWSMSFTRQFGPIQSNHGLGASPTQSPTQIIISIENRATSKIVALSKSDGAIAWSHDRPQGNSYASPIVVPWEDGHLVVLSSQGRLDVYGAEDGKHLLHMEGIEGNTLPSPTWIGDHIVLAARIPEFGSSAEAARSNCCLRLVPGEPWTAEVLWRSTKAVCDYASPVVVGDRVFIVNSVGVLFCLSLTDGQELYAERLNVECWATPIVSQDRLYFFGKDGETVVVPVREPFQVLARNRLWPADRAPRPEKYREKGFGYPENATQQPGPSPAERFLSRTLQMDTNNDGRLSTDELTGPEAQMLLRRGDTNKDQELDKEELQKLAEMFAARRSQTRAAARDPIVYGAAAVPGYLLIRTGTRLYCVSESQPQ